MNLAEDKPYNKQEDERVDKIIENDFNSIINKPIKQEIEETKDYKMSVKI